MIGNRPRASIIVRAKDKEATIERTLDALRRQTVPVEIIVIDSGSRDRTVEIARARADRLIEVPAERFSYGGTLNLAARVAEAPVLFALSAHCVPAREDWVERSLAHYADDRVAATGGYVGPSPDGDGHGVVLQDHAMLRADPFWGLSNHASSWRRDVWEGFAFDERLTASEDREWSWRVTQAGWVIAMDADLEVVSRHRVQAGFRAYFERNAREARGIAAFAPAEYSVLALLRDCWHVRPPAGRSAARVRLSPWQATALAGKYWGMRTARRARSVSPRAA